MKVDFLQFIEQNYEQIKNMLLQYKDFDEDIFHNTIIKCNEIIQQSELNFNSENDIIRYFIGAYRTNVLREKLYYYNKNSDHKEIEEIDRIDKDNIQIEDSVDFNIIKEDIKKHFGEKLGDVYLKYISDNISISNLQKETHIKNLKQRIKEIKEYITKKYKGET